MPLPYTSKLLKRVRNRKRCIYMHGWTHVRTQRILLHEERRGIPGKERGRKRKDGGKAFKTLLSFRKYHSYLLLQILMQTCLFKVLGVRNEGEDQVNWMLPKLDETFAI